MELSKTEDNHCNHGMMLFKEIFRCDTKREDVESPSDKQLGGRYGRGNTSAKTCNNPPQSPQPSNPQTPDNALTMVCRLNILRTVLTMRRLCSSYDGSFNRKLFGEPYLFDEKASGITSRELPSIS